MPLDLAKIGERIRTIRGNVNGATFGAMIGVSANMVSNYESGQAWPKPHTLDKIIALSGKTADWLLYGNESSTQPESTPITCPLADDEQRAIHTAKDLLERYGLSTRFRVAEIHHPPPQGEQLAEEEKRLLRAFRALSERAKQRKLEDLEELAGFISEERPEDRPSLPRSDEKPKKEKSAGSTSFER